MIFCAVTQNMSWNENEEMVAQKLNSSSFVYTE